MINNVVLVGRLTKDPDLRFTANGQAVATFTLAVNRNFTNQNGSRDADFINCVIWRKPAETLANYAHKGTLLGITGRIQTRNYENQQGQRVYVTEVVSETFQLLESKNTTENRQQQTNNQNQSSAPYPDPYENLRTDRNISNEDLASQTHLDGVDPMKGGSIDISDDDLPF